MNQSNRILVINCGSSSLKDRSGTKQTIEFAAEYGQTHQSAFDCLLSVLKQENYLEEPVKAVGHRVVHGGEAFSASVVINDEVLAEIDKNSRLAPLHNPANLIGIEAAQAAFPDVPHVAVFDTAFHQTMPAHAYTYSIPYSLYEEQGVRRYGFFMEPAINMSLKKPLSYLA